MTAATDVACLAREPELVGQTILVNGGSAGIGLENPARGLRSTVPIGRVAGRAEVAALAVPLMLNTAVTGARYDINGGQQFTS